LASTKFLFWNINRQPVASLIAELATLHQVDVVVLAESATSKAEMLMVLNRDTANRFRYAPGLSRRITMFTRFSRRFLRPRFESDYLSIRALELPGRDAVLVAAVHLSSKLWRSNESQIVGCVEVAQEIIRVEDRAGHRRTVLVGDFNMNPFEVGMVSAGGFNAVTSRAIASRYTRTVHGREYPFFYNPMWSHFGDSRSETAGSYYYDAGEHVNYYWHLFDQVLLRPELAARFRPDWLQIIKAIGPRSLVTDDGRPNSAVASDHLPIVFEVEF
jgi:hypothetical protein